MRLISFGIAAVLGASIVSHAATTITFDDVAAGPAVSWSPVPNGYAGFEWSGFGIINASVEPSYSGFRRALVSEPNIAFNLSGALGLMRRSGGFSLHSAHLVMPHEYGPSLVEMHVRIRGMVGTNVTYDNTYTLNNTRTLIAFDYIGVDRVLFAASPDIPFAMDDLVVTVPPPDSGCTYVVSPRNPTQGLAAGTGSVTVAAQDGCEWSISNTNNWITILSPLNNSGNGTVRYAVSATTAERTGVIKVAGQSITIIQSARPSDGRQTLTFDDLLRGLVPGGYGGLDWINYGVLDATVSPSYTGAMISPDNVAYNQNGNPTTIRGSAPFDLHSAYVTARINPPDVRSELRVEGFTGATLVYDNLYIFTNLQPVLIEFNYLGVTEVRLSSTSSSPFFPIDNVTVTVFSDSDADDDGVPDDQDRCPDTPAGDVVNQHGCSIDQLVPCSGPARGGAWRNHGEYVAAVVKVTETFRRAGLITARERNAIIHAAAQSDCGKPVRLRWPVRRATGHRR